MLKYEQNCSHVGGGDAIPLKTWSPFSTVKYICNYRLSDKSHGTRVLA